MIPENQIIMKILRLNSNEWLSFFINLQRCTILL